MSNNNYLTDPITGKKYPVGGCLISREPSDLPKFGSMRTVQSKYLPPSADLRQLMTPIEHQEQLNSWFVFFFFSLAFFKQIFN